ncbi:hypothetical protein LWI29_008151 [Acer saccharum]|uniref:DUF659 domain-containing protein n=1 Tax=Acer saccharum TaxID=4024 RepID=A0AA39RVJ9_ACESA|nr:hypothetical protein LWI29_008151 [Acer saccharum]
MDRYVLNVEEDEAKLGEDKKQESDKEARDRTYMDICGFFFENGIAYNIANSPSFINMYQSIGSYMCGLKLPTTYELRTSILKVEEANMQAIVVEVKKTWAQTGVSIMLDGWKDIGGRQLINFLVNNLHVTIFLKSIDASNVVKDATILFKLLDKRFIYGALDNANDEIAKILGDKEGVYNEIWKIINEKWEIQLHRHLHAVACFLNPQFQYSENPSTHPEIKLGLTNMAKLIPNVDDRYKADLQIDAFKNKKGMFSFGMAKTLNYNCSSGM